MRLPGKIVIHHVGGRWGNRPFPTLPRFAADFIVVLFEADEEAIAGIREACRDEAAELIILPYCLAASSSEAKLHVYVNPGLTSLRQFGETLRRRYLYLFGVDFDLDGAGARLLERRNVTTYALDDILRSNHDACPMPDFLSLDVQGAEYEVLLGAETALRQSVCGLIVEVEFGHMYAGQKRFQDICDLLSGHGFEFVRFLSIGEASGPAAPLGFRLGGYQSWADALFLRRAETVAHFPDPTEKLAKLCFIAVVFGNIELAIACAEQLSGTASTSSAEYPRLAYQAFVEELGQTYRNAVKIWPPVFSKILPAHRFLDYARAAGPELWPAIFEGLQTFEPAYVEQLDALQKAQDTEFEALLRRYDFTDTADQVNFTRRHQAHLIKQAVVTARAARRS